MAHRTQENTLLVFTGLLKSLQLGNSQMEEMYRTGFDRRGMPPAQHLPCRDVFTSSESLSSGVFTELRFPGGQVSGTKISNSLITWSFWWPAPSRGCLEARPLLISLVWTQVWSKEKRTLCKEIPRVLRALCWQPGMKNRYICYSITIIKILKYEKTAKTHVI